MRKSEIIEELQELKKILDMDYDEYITYAKDRFGSKLTWDDVFAHRTGVIHASIDWILCGGVK